MTSRPRLYFYLRSPFSWMALKRLEERIPQAPEIIDYFPYWEPGDELAAALAQRGAEVLYRPMSKVKHLYILADTKRLAERFGYPMAWPVDRKDACWDLPNLAWLQARRQGAERPFYQGLVQARWEHGENICDPAVLTRVAETAGLDGPAIVDAVHDQATRQEAIDALAASYDDDVFGIPYFKIGSQRYWGLDRLDDFCDALSVSEETDILRGIPDAVRDAVGSYDCDSAGGCG